MVLDRSCVARCLGFRTGTCITAQLRFLVKCRCKCLTLGVCGLLGKISSRLTYANVMATAAVFIALGGGAYAAFRLPANSVGTRHVKRHAVTRSKLDPGAPRARSRVSEAKRGRRERAGKSGSEGDPGATGDPGTPGRDGAAVVARVRSTSSVQTPADGSAIAVPLSASTWTQAQGELDFGTYGSVTFTDPPAGSCGGSGLVSLQIDVDIDGKQFSVTNVEALRDGGTRTAGLDHQDVLLEPDAAVARTATATVSGVCESGSFPLQVTINSLKFDIVRTSSFQPGSRRAKEPRRALAGDNGSGENRTSNIAGAIPRTRQRHLAVEILVPARGGCRPSPSVPGPVVM